MASPNGMLSLFVSSVGVTSGLLRNITSRMYALWLGYIIAAWTVSTSMSQSFSFVNSSLDYYEEFFKTKIIRLPHPSLPRMLNNFVFQAPENCQIIEQAGIPDFDYLDQVEQTVEIVGYKGEVWSAVGVRTADSPMRRTAIVRYGTINQKQKKFYPIHDWNKERLLNEMKAAKVKLPIDYKLFGRSFDGIDFRFLYPIKKNFPEDYEKIIAAFPLAELEIQRRGFHEKHKQQYGL